MSEIAPDYIAGFFDGEGSIDAHVHPQPSSLGYYMDPRLRIADGWLAGFFDAEGLITANIQQGKDGRHTFNPSARINISDGAQVLLEIQRYLLEKTIKSYFEYHYKNFSRILVIQGRHQVGPFLSLVLPYLHVKREQARIMLEEVLPRIAVGKHLTKMGFIEIMAYVDRLNTCKPPAAAKHRKYTKAYFQRLWGLE